jgi:hypothetical protein
VFIFGQNICKFLDLSIGQDVLDNNAGKQLS